MDDLLPQVHGLLARAGYSVAPAPSDATALDFEDLASLGRVFIFPSGRELAEGWKSRQDQFLAENAAHFRRDPLKAWNLYTVFLSPAPCSTETTRLLFAMEEDFRGTRKIARAGLTGRDDIELALAPLLPLRNLRVVGIEDATSRLEQRLGAIGQALTDLGRDVPAGAIAARLMVTK